MVKRITLLASLTLLTLMGLAGSGPAEAQGPSYQPVMTGDGGAPSTEIRSNQNFTYAVTQTDKDTDTSNNQFVDTTAALNWNIVSMQPYTWMVRLRSRDANGVSTWDVSGKAVVVAQPLNFEDALTLYNQRYQGDPYMDPYLTVYHLVQIAP